MEHATKFGQPRKEPDGFGERVPALSPLNNGLMIVGKIVLFLAFAIHAFNVDYAPISAGPDPSWQYIINYAFDQRLEFSFTSGPLGFINAPLDVGANLEIAILVRVAFWLALCGWFGVLLLKNTFPLRNLTVFVGLFALGSQISIGSWASFRSTSGFGSPFTFDYLVCFVVLFLLSHACCFPRRWLWLYSVALGLSACLALVKLSAAILTAASCLMFGLVMFWTDRRKAALATGLAVIGIPLLFSAAYLSYDPSGPRMLTYFRRAFDIAAGYNVAMSVSGNPLALWLALAIIGVYAGQTLLFFRLHRQSAWLSLLYLPAFFFIFKHSFVRQDGHETIFFLVSSLIFALIWLFTPMTRRSIGLLGLLLPLLIARFGIPLYATDLGSLLGIPKLVVMNELVHYGQTKAELRHISRQTLQGYRLPPPWRQAIGSRDIAILPWEAAFVPANDLTYRPFPIIQSYSAYTAYLDAENARFLARSSAAPDFVLLQWVAMDSRHVLLDVPGTWLELYRWYDDVDVFWNIALLRRRASPRFHDVEFLEQRIVETGEFIEIPFSHHPLLVHMHLELTMLGKLAKLFYKVPEVRLEFVETAGRRSSRVVPDTLSNPLFINALPVMLQDASRLMTASEWHNRVYGIFFSGEGLPLYKKNFRIELYKIPDVLLTPALPDLSQLADQGAATAYALEKIFVFSPRPRDSQGASSSPSFLMVQGWALDEERHQRAGDVYIDIDGQLYRAYYGMPEEDSGEGFQQFDADHVAFQAVIPTAEIGKGPHSLALRILTPDRQRYYSSSDHITFEIP